MVSAMGHSRQTLEALAVRNYPSVKQQSQRYLAWPLLPRATLCDQPVELITPRWSNIRVSFVVSELDLQLVFRLAPSIHRLGSDADSAGIKTKANRTQARNFMASSVLHLARNAVTPVNATEWPKRWRENTPD